MAKRSTPVMFGQAAAKRIAAAVRRSEGTPSGAYSGRGQRAGGAMYLQPASVTTAIPTGSLGAPSTAGRATIYRDNDSGGLVAAETGAEVHNFHTLSASIAAGKTITCYWRAGVWWLVAVDC